MAKHITPKNAQAAVLAASAGPEGRSGGGRARFAAYMKRYWVLYALILPAFVYTVIFSYLPMYGVQISFREYNPIDGIWGSPWVGWKFFNQFFESAQFWDLLKNTLALSLYSLAAGFPFPILFALLLNYLVFPHFRKFSQMVTYAPHFISTVVLCGMITIFLQQDGVLNHILGVFQILPVGFLSTPSYFKHIYVWTGILQNMGFDSIIYISVLTSVSPELHEAACVDGASKLQRVLHIDLPELMPTVMILLIMNAGSIMSVGFEKAYLLQNDVNLQVSEIISTYVYKVGLQGAQFSYSSAIGLFNNIINLIILVIVNQVSSRVSDTSLW